MTCDHFTFLKINWCVEIFIFIAVKARNYSLSLTEQPKRITDSSFWASQRNKNLKPVSLRAVTCMSVFAVGIGSSRTDRRLRLASSASCIGGWSIANKQLKFTTKIISADICYFLSFTDLVVRVPSGKAATEGNLVRWCIKQSVSFLNIPFRNSPVKVPFVRVTRSEVFHRYLSKNFNTVFSLRLKL